MLKTPPRRRPFRPRPGRKPPVYTKRLHLPLSPEEKEWIDAHAAATGCGRADLLRRAIYSYLPAGPPPQEGDR